MNLRKDHYRRERKHASIGPCRYRRVGYYLCGKEKSGRRRWRPVVRPVLGVKPGNCESYSSSCPRIPVKVSGYLSRSSSCRDERAGRVGVLVFARQCGLHCEGLKSRRSSRGRPTLMSLSPLLTVRFPNERAVSLRRSAAKLKHGRLRFPNECRPRRLNTDVSYTESGIQTRGSFRYGDRAPY